MDIIDIRIKKFFSENNLPSPDFSTEQIVKLNTYLIELRKWNQRINLVSSNDIPNLEIHLLDSIVLSPLLSCFDVLDIGSGSGFPAIPLAILLPDIKFVLIESRAKKCSFLTHIKLLLNLNNVEVINKRIESYKGNFQCITARAFQPLSILLSTSFPFLEKSGKIYSHISGKQIIPVDKRYTIREVFPYKLPMVKKARRIVIFQKKWVK